MPRRTFVPRSYIHLTDIFAAVAAEGDVIANVTDAFARQSFISWLTRKSRAVNAATSLTKWLPDQEGEGGHGQTSRLFPFHDPVKMSSRFRILQNYYTNQPLHTVRG
jgi:hypothetical protein